jgi:hypothetical protein
MFATAHRVRSYNGQTGINAFVHFHGAGFPWPAEPWHLPEDAPGEPDPARERIDIRPGGNRVCAFLDLLAPDGTPTAALEIAVEALWLELTEAEASGVSTTDPIAYECEGVAMRFGVPDKAATQGSRELLALMEALRPLLVGLRHAA